MTEPRDKFRGEQAPIDNALTKEFQAVVHAVRDANQNGMLVELVWSIAQQNTGTVGEKIATARREWDL